MEEENDVVDEGRAPGQSNDNDVDDHTRTTTDADDEAVPRVVIDRESMSMSTLHKRYGYEPDTGQNPIAMARKKLKGCRCGLDQIKKFFLYVFPAFAWLPKYDIKRNTVGDVMAGLIVGTVNIPQSMAFSLLVVLPPVYGLYTAFFAPLAFFLMGSSRHTSVGTFGVISILSGNAVEKIISQRYPSTTSQPSLISASQPITAATDVFVTMNATAETPACGLICGERLQIHTTLCLMVGLIQMSLAVMRFGFVTTYLAQPLIRAFTCGAACHVVTSQVPPFLGLSIPRYAGPLSLFYSWRDIFINLTETNVATLLFGLLTILILAPGKYLTEKYKHKIKIPVPWELFVVVVTILISYFVNVADKYGVDIIGEVPVGFPTPSVPSLPPWVSIGDLFGDAIAIAVVGFALSVSMAKIFATVHDYEIDSNQELLAYGASNASSSFFSCFVSASALARVALLSGSGGKTQVSMLVSSVIIMVVLLLIGPLFEPLPKSVLASIIIFALRGILAQVTDLTTLYKTSLIDCVIWVVTWLAVIFLGVDLGLGVGVVFALFTVICRTQLPGYSNMGGVGESELYCDANEYKSLGTTSDILIFKMQTSLYYANAQQFKSKLLQRVGIKPTQSLPEPRPARCSSTADSKQTPGANVVNSNGVSIRKTRAPSSDRVRVVIIDCSHFGFIDVGGAKTLMSLMGDFRKIGVEMRFCCCEDSVMNSIKVICQIDEKKGDIFFPSVLDAVTAVSKKPSASPSDTLDTLPVHIRDDVINGGDDVMNRIHGVGVDDDDDNESDTTKV